jgi:hypothetical protein
MTEYKLQIMFSSEHELKDDQALAIASNMVKALTHLNLTVTDSMIIEDMSRYEIGFTEMELPKSSD